jgi:hypothetical protein
MSNDIEQLKEENERLAKRNAILVAEIEDLRFELDDVKREVCEWCAIFTKETPQIVAKKNNWDCFKEEPCHTQKS